MGKQAAVREAWRQRLTEQEQSRDSIRAYCEEHGWGEHSLYAWRQRLRSDGASRFALVESTPVSEGPKPLELVLGGGAAAGAADSAGRPVIGLPAGVRVYPCTVPCDMRPELRSAAWAGDRRDGTRRPGWTRDVESEHIPAAREGGMSIVPWSPLAGGFLTSKYDHGNTGDTGRLNRPNPFGDSKFVDRNWDILEALKTVAADASARWRKSLLPG